MLTAKEHTVDGKPNEAYSKSMERKHPFHQKALEKQGKNLKKSGAFRFCSPQV